MGEHGRMMLTPPPEEGPPADLEDGLAGGSIPGQLSILDLIDECAAAMGIGGWEYTSSVNPRNRLR